jgi:hypothetical protein
VVTQGNQVTQGGLTLFSDDPFVSPDTLRQFASPQYLFGPAADIALNIFNNPYAPTSQLYPCPTEEWNGWLNDLDKAVPRPQAPSVPYDGMVIPGIN